MALGLGDIKLTEQDTRLVLFSSTVFKLKYKTSHELRDSAKSQGRVETIQRELKRATAAILSQVLTHNTLSNIRTDTIAVYTGSRPWAVCDKLYFGHQDRPLNPHPHIILMLVSLVPPQLQQLQQHQHSLVPPQPQPQPQQQQQHSLVPPQPQQQQQHKKAHSQLGKHKRQQMTSDQELSHPATDGPTIVEPLLRKRLHTVSDPEAGTHVPSSSEAALPVGSVGGGGKEVPGRTQVVEAADASKQRLQTLSQPCWEDKEEVKAQETSSEEGGSLFRYVKRFFGWM